MAAGIVYDAKPVVQVSGPNLAGEARLATFQSLPSNSTLIYTIPETSYQDNQGRALLDSLSNAVENLLSAGVAISAEGTQGIDPSGLIFDAVTFTVRYVPPVPIPGEILGDVQIDVRVVDADLSIIGGSGAQNAAQLIDDEYNRLKALAGA